MLDIKIANCYKLEISLIINYLQELSFTANIL